MTTTELNAELYRQLSYIAHDEGFLQKTLDFVKGLTKSKNASGTKGIVYTRMLERLSDYQEYQKGWDGEDAAPLNTIVVRNFKKVLLQVKEDFFLAILYKLEEFRQLYKLEGKFLLYMHGRQIFYFLYK